MCVSPKRRSYEKKNLQWEIIRRICYEFFSFYQFFDVVEIHIFISISNESENNKSKIISRRSFRNLILATLILLKSQKFRLHFHQF